MTEWLVSILLVIGGFFVLLAAVGIYRMPDLFTRMHAATKSGTVGAGFILMAVGFHFAELGITFRVVLIISFLLLTAPVAANRIARAGYFIGERLWKGTVLNELQGQYDIKTHSVKSPKQ